jgi:UDP-glucuronate 4-epimerase
MKRDALTGRKVVITGVTGQVARPLAVTLARDNEVYGAARFTDAAARAALDKVH